MDSIRSALHAIAVFLSSVLDPVVEMLTRGGTVLRRFLDDNRIPPVVQPVIVIGCWLVVVLVLIRFLRGGKRLLALGVVALLVLRIYRLMPDY